MSGDKQPSIKPEEQSQDIQADVLSAIDNLRLGKGDEELLRSNLEQALKAAVEAGYIVKSGDSYIPTEDEESKEGQEICEALKDLYPIVEDLVDIEVTNILNSGERETVEPVIENDPLAELTERLKGEQDDAQMELTASEKSIAEYRRKLLEIRQNIKDLPHTEELVKHYREAYEIHKKGNISVSNEGTVAGEAYKLFEQEEQALIALDILTKAYPEYRLKFMCAKTGFEISTQISGNDFENAALINEVFQARMLSESLSKNPESGGSYEVVFAAVGFENIDDEDKKILIQLMLDNKIKVTDNQRLVIVGEMDSDEAIATRSVLVDLADKYQTRLLEIFAQPQEGQENLSASDAYKSALEIINNNDSGIVAMLRMVAIEDFDRMLDASESGDTVAEKFLLKLSKVKEPLLVTLKENLISGLLKIDMTGEIVPGDLGEKSQAAFDSFRSDVFDKLSMAYQNDVERKIRESSKEQDHIMALAEERLRELSERIKDFEEKRANGEFSSRRKRAVAFIANNFRKDEQYLSENTERLMEFDEKFQQAMEQYKEDREEIIQLRAFIDCAENEKNLEITALRDLSFEVISHSEKMSSQEYSYAGVEGILRVAEEAQNLSEEAVPVSARARVADLMDQEIEEQQIELPNNTELIESVDPRVVDDIRMHVEAFLTNQFRDIIKSCDIEKFTNKSDEAKIVDAFLKTYMESEGYGELFSAISNKYLLQEGLGQYIIGRANEGLSVGSGSEIFSLISEMQELQYEKEKLEADTVKYFRRMVSQSRKVMRMEDFRTLIFQIMGMDGPDLQKVISKVSLDIDAEIITRLDNSAELINPEALDEEERAEAADAARADGTQPGNNQGRPVNISDNDSSDSGGPDFQQARRTTRSNIETAANSSRRMSSKKPGFWKGFLNVLGINWEPSKLFSGVSWLWGGK
jgi:hypothetical protein